MSMLGESGWRNETWVRTGISGRNPLRWLPTERLSERRDSDCECWANGAENARVKDYRILVCVSLLPGRYLSDFLSGFWSRLELTRVRYEERKKDMLCVFCSVTGDPK